MKTFRSFFSTFDRANGDIVKAKVFYWIVSITFSAAIGIFAELCFSVQVACLLSVISLAGFSVFYLGIVLLGHFVRYSIIETAKAIAVEKDSDRS